VSEYADDRSQLHRPLDADTLRVAAFEMYSRGLTPFDIAAALQISEVAVRQLLGQTMCAGMRA
jgi:DNA-binding transcriptional regulator LsrR (DeoR family)